MIYKPDDFRYVNYSWDYAVADKLDPVERLRYRSNILGSDQRITNTGARPGEIRQTLGWEGLLDRWLGRAGVRAA